MEDRESCCEAKERKTSGFWSGLIYGLLPHSFCLTFLVFSILGASALTGFLRPFLMVPYFFPLLIGLSLVFASISAIIYLRKESLLSLSGIKKKWKYLSVLYGATIGINLLLFMVVLPQAANIKSSQIKSSAAFSEAAFSQATLEVAIPCPGHAPLIIDELGKVKGIGWVEFKFPNLFKVNFEAGKVTAEQILALEIFKTYKARIL